MTYFTLDTNAPHDIDGASQESANRAKTIIDLLRPKTPSVELKRFGNLNDGGYVLANDLNGDDFLLSFGVANDVGFELRISHIVSGMHLYDNSVDNSPAFIHNASFFKEKICSYDDHESSSVSKCLNRASGYKDYILKIDIEGYEWEVFSNILESDLNKFRQITVEIHWMKQILNNEFYDVVVRALQNLSKNHQPINVHCNNYSQRIDFGGVALPEVIEITYVRKDSYSFIDYDDSKYHELNTPNDPVVPDHEWELQGTP